MRFMLRERNCSGSHQDTKIDLPAIALAQARQAGMDFTPLPEKEERIARKIVD